MINQKNQRTYAAQRDLYYRKQEQEELQPDLWLATLEGVKTPEQDVIERQQCQMLWDQIDRLPHRITLAVRLSYGIGCEPHSLEQVGDKLNVSKERARQIIARGERTLRYRMLLREDRKLWRELIGIERSAIARKQRFGASQAAEAKRQEEVYKQRSTYQAEAKRQEEIYKQRSAYQEAHPQILWDMAYAEAHELNQQWDAELRRRKEDVEWQRNVVKRTKAFEQQAQDLKDARDAYYASIGTPAEKYCGMIYLRELQDWGPRNDRIWSGKFNG